MFAKVLPLLERAVKWFLASLETSTTGSSARKWTALAGVLVSLFITAKHTTAQNVGEILVIWLTFVALLLGLVTYQQIQDARGKSPAPNNPQT
jgi:uncharacterized membrane protein YdcZ (DUF606 family)